MKSPLAQLWCLCMTIAVTTAATSQASPSRFSPVSSELFQRFVRYTNFTSASLHQPCPHPPYGAKVVTLINETSSDTQASIFLDDANKDIILSIPGTSGPRDFFTDLGFVLVPYTLSGSSCNLCLVHEGFLAAWNSIASQVQTVLHDTLAAHPSYKVTITGHSLGGSIAQIAYASLKSQGFPATAYTMGQSRVGNAAFANFIERLAGASHGRRGDFYRLTHASDLVPQLPPALGYVHSRTEYWQRGPRVQKAATTFRCVGRESLACNRGHQDAFDPETRDDHGLYSNINIGDPASCGL